MALLTKQEYADKCGITTSYLSMPIKRGNVVCVGDMIDPEHPKNKAYLNKKVSKKPELQAPKQIPREETYRPPAINVGKVYEDEDIEVPEEVYNPNLMPLPLAEQTYKHNLAIKTERESELKRLDIEKKKGIVVPSAPIIPIFLQHNQHILTEQKNADEEMLTYISHKYGISGADQAHLRGEWVKNRNAAMKKATDASVKAVKSVINDYSEKRGVGERL